ncbi:hypothetical protein EFZ50_14335, partial [Salmonella enterica]|nr:hypothetical protein [Salmonella enterica]
VYYHFYVFIVLVLTTPQWLSVHIGQLPARKEASKIHFLAMLVGALYSCRMRYAARGITNPVRLLNPREAME